MSMTRLFLCSVLLLGLIAQASAESGEILSLPTDGSPVRTAEPLEAYRAYFIILHSPHDLRRVWRGWKGYLVQFNGQKVDGQQVTMVSQWQYQRPMHEMQFRITGTGDPLTIQLAEDLSGVLPKAVVEITPVSDYNKHIAATVLGVVFAVGFLALLVSAIWWGATKAARRQRALCRQEEYEEARRALEREAVEAQARRLEAKARVWINREHEEPWLKDADFCHDYAKREHAEILTQLKDEWHQDRRTVTGDAELTRYLTQHAPQVLQWLEARLQVIDLAKRAAIDALEEDTPPKQTPDEWEAKQRAHAQRMADRDYQAAELTIVQTLQYRLRLQSLHDRLLTEHPDHQTDIDKLFQQYEEFKSAPPPPAEKEPVSPAPTPPAPIGPEIL